ncbi:MAG: PIG-L family deacetylase [Candidatus Omnitrophica bacterium]|nr:PIG-L family deacetylase [Candidatus Omnitrophota bacterium]
MNKRIILIAIAVITAVFFSGDRLRAQELRQITSADRVLIMAPHPDDETLGAAGIIQKAVKAGADLRIMYLTNGEHNELAFIVYEKRFVFKQRALVEMGVMRQKEAISAMKFLGVPEEKLIFLGYPDFGTLAIFLRYWGEVRPFKNMLTRISQVPYKNALTPNAPYKGEAIVGDIESVLKQYKPTMIFVTDSVDTNRDHRSMYLFLRVALWQLKGVIPEPEIHPYLIHCYGWPRPRNYHPDLALEIPASLKDSQIAWESSALSKEEVNRKYMAIRKYRSQCSDSAFYLTAFARKNELFGDYPVVELDNLGDLPEKARFQIATVFRNRTVTYGRIDDKLIVSIFLKRESGKPRGFYLNLEGYNPEIEFSQMPKIKINVRSEGVRILDRGKFIDSEEIKMEQKDHSVYIKIPFKLLKDPQYILASVNTYTTNYASDLNAWRIIKVR